jgi:hypothetical protein
MTTQLQREHESKNAFRAWCVVNNWNIVKEFEPHENKLEQHSHDFICVLDADKEVSVSLKTLGGLFTKANLGTGVIAASKWLNDDVSLNLLRDCAKEAKRRRESLSFQRWSDSPQIEADKLFVIEPWLDAYMTIWSVKDYRHSFFNYLLSLQSDFIWSENRLLNFDSIASGVPQRYLSKSILLGSIEARFKSEGGSVSSSIKINIQPAVSAKIQGKMVNFQIISH